MLHLFASIAATIQVERGIRSPSWIAISHFALEEPLAGKRMLNRLELTGRGSIPSLATTLQ